MGVVSLFLTIRTLSLLSEGKPGGVPKPWGFPIFFAKVLILSHTLWEIPGMFLVGTKTSANWDG